MQAKGLAMDKGWRKYTRTIWDKKKEKTERKKEDIPFNCGTVNMPCIDLWCTIHKKVDSSLTGVVLAQGATLRIPR